MCGDVRGSVVTQDASASPVAASPVAEFCAALRALRQASGADPAALARKVGISRTQLYAILAGDIRRPPDWDRVVRPLVAACSGNDPAAIAAWRQRHGALTEAVEQLRRQARQQRRAAPSAPDVP
jgi:hypothetical protein